MTNRHVLSLLAAGSLLLSASAARAQTEIQWWHAMTGANNDVIVKLAEDFNASQKDYKVVPAYKGSYPDTITPASRRSAPAGAAHHAGVRSRHRDHDGCHRAVKPVHVLMKEAGEAFDPKTYLPTITGYYSTTKGEMLSFPFNSSSAVMWYNKDAFKKAGLDPNTPPKTWPEVFDFAKKLKAAGYANCGFSNAWATWLNVEQLAAWHKHGHRYQGQRHGRLRHGAAVQRAAVREASRESGRAAKGQDYDYSGRTNTGEGRFTSGECPIFLTSSGFFGNVKANAKFEWANAPMP